MTATNADITTTTTTKPRSVWRYRVPDDCTADRFITTRAYLAQSSGRQRALESPVSRLFTRTCHRVTLQSFGGGGNEGRFAAWTWLYIPSTNCSTNADESLPPLYSPHPPSCVLHNRFYVGGKFTRLLIFIFMCESKSISYIFSFTCFHSWFGGWTVPFWIFFAIFSAIEKVNVIKFR